MEVAVMTTEAVDMVDPETIMAAGKLFQIEANCDPYRLGTENGQRCAKCFMPQLSHT